MLWPKKRTHNPTMPESLNAALDDDMQQERRILQQHRAESLKALTDGISTNVTCVIGGDCTATVYQVLRIS